MNIFDLYDTFLSSTGISTDTRRITPGNIFFALRGENFNGNTYASQALTDGASLAVIDDPAYETPHTLLVSSALETLQELAQFHRMQLDIPVVGLTGSNGKTTTKELMHAVLSQQYHTLATEGNLNNHIGVPLTLLRITKDHEIAIIEMGANHQGEIRFLCSLCQPDIGYITNFGRAHLEGFGGTEGVIKGKSELYDYLRANSKTAIVNNDDPLQIRQSSGLKTITFGTSETANVAIRRSDKAGSYVSLLFGSTEIQSRLTGQYNFYNLAAALTLGVHFKVEIEAVKSAIESYTPTNNRSQVTQTEKNILIVDTYNANPSSMEAAIENLKAFPGIHKWVILGDMFELGEYEQSEHQKISDSLETCGFEKVLLAGRVFSKSKAKDALQFETTDALMDFLKREKPENKTILIKGSRGMKLERVIPLL